MSFSTTICSFNIFDCLKFCEKDIRYSLCPNDDTETLIAHSEELMRKRGIVQTKLDRHLGNYPNCKAKDEITKWLDESEQVKKNVDSHLDSLSKVKGCLGSCFCISNRSLGKRTSVLKMTTERLLREHEKVGYDLSNMIEVAPPPRIMEVPNITSKVIGREKLVRDIIDYIENESYQIIGICGAGGIGKTTLLSEVNKVLHKKESCCFDHVIFVRVSQKGETEKIQNEIGMFMKHQLPDDPEERSSSLFQRLTNGRMFLFLMDDIWTTLDLKNIGIPIGHKNCKMLLATRFRDVCHRMDVQKIFEVGYLDKDKSWELFSMNLYGNVDLADKQIAGQAMELAKRCKGLPLALKVVARAVASYTTIHEWHDAVHRFESLEGVEDEVLHILKFSYDHLNDRNIQLCLLCCSLYSGYYDIFTKEIIAIWIGEGLLDNDTKNEMTIRDSQSKGYSIIAKLRSASLIERSPSGDYYICIHDIVRDMCLYITNGKHNEENIIVWNSTTLEDNMSLVEAKVQQWERATKVSLVASKIEDFGCLIPYCPKLVTLLLKGCDRLTGINRDFFQFMGNLRVLDLSYTGLKEIPPSISFLIKLEYLNLRGTKINALPKEVGNLISLRQLFLIGTKELCIIPKYALSHLGALEKLALSFSGYKWEHTEDGNIGDSFQLKDFKEMRKLNELHIDICSTIMLEHLISCSFFQKVINVFLLKGSDFQARDIIKASRAFPYMMHMTIHSCHSIEDIVFCWNYLTHLEVLGLHDNSRLRSITLEGDEETCETSSFIGKFPRAHIPFGCVQFLSISRCPLIIHLSFLKQLLSLQHLTVEDCKGLEDIVINDHTIPTMHDKPLRLQLLSLKNLPNLKFICVSWLIPSLTGLDVYNCPKLRKLPFETHTCKIKRIRGTKDWWDILEWDNDTIRSQARPCFEPLIN